MCFGERRHSSLETTQYLIFPRVNSRSDSEGHFHASRPSLPKILIVFVAVATDDNTPQAQTRRVRKSVTRFGESN